MAPTPNVLQHFLMHISSSRPGAWFFARFLHRLDRAALRLTGGRQTVSRVIGLPLVTLTTTGARSGQSRSVPLVGIPDGERVILIASNWGQKKHPAWYHNVLAHPQVTLAVDGEPARYQARVVVGEERKSAWAKAVAYYPGYAAYQRRVEREIPVVVLKPRSHRP